MESINTKLVEKIHIVTDMKEPNVQAAKNLIDDQGYRATGWGPVLNGLPSAWKWEIKGEKDFQDTSRVAKSSRYLVKADHPILKRIDKIVYTGELSMFIMTLETMNYENIEIISEKFVVS
jgi:hypothetical protein